VPYEYEYEYDELFLVSATLACRKNNHSLLANRMAHGDYIFFRLINNGLWSNDMKIHSTCLPTEWLLLQSFSTYRLLDLGNITHFLLLAASSNSVERVTPCQLKQSILSSERGRVNAQYICLRHMNNDETLSMPRWFRVVQKYT